jgi:hypothetical protein
VVDYDAFRVALDRMVCEARARQAEAQARQAEAEADLARMFEWREWFGFRPGWPSRRAVRLAGDRVRLR